MTLKADLGPPHEYAHIFMYTPPQTPERQTVKRETETHYTNRQTHRGSSSGTNQLQPLPPKKLPLLVKTLLYPTVY